MKLTPLEIQKKKFSKSFRGYNEAEVTDYLDKISRNYEELYKENRELKENVISLTERLNDYKDMEQTLKDAILMAQKTAENVKNNAQKEKQFIIKQAVAKAAQIIDKAERTFNNIKNQNDELKRQFSLYKTRFINFLESQYELINSYQLDITDITSKDCSKAFSEVAASVDKKTEIENENKNKNKKAIDAELDKNKGVKNEEKIAIHKNRGNVTSNNEKITSDKYLKSDDTDLNSL